ncbi:unnamed protein product [Absidia cylindrospora]
MVMSMLSKSKPVLMQMSACRYLSTSPIRRVYFQNNSHNGDGAQVPSVAMDPQAKLYDFRSDTVTAPTDEMFEVMKKATRNDSVFEEDDSVRDLERYVADLTGHEAGLFCASGTMTNQLGLRVHLTQPPHSVACDSQSHVYLHENGGIAYHSRASVSPVIASNGVHVTATEMESNLIDADLYSAPTRVISLENTLHGMVMPLRDMQEIAALARDRDIAMHMDGARLWNAHIASGVSLADYGQCFDSMSLCLSKGVGAPIGSMLVGNKKYINRARHLRKLFGGGWRQAGSLAAAAKYGIDHIVPTMETTHSLTRYLASQLVSMDIDLQSPVHTNMVLIDSTRVGLNIQNDVAPALLRKNIKIGCSGTKSRIVLHHQIDKEGVDTMLNVFREALAEHNTRKFIQDQPLMVAEA